MSLRTASWGWAPMASLDCIMVSGAMSAMLASIRFCISAISASLSGVTSGKPMNRRASSGVHSTSTVNFILGSGSRSIPVIRPSIDRTQLQEECRRMGEWVEVKGKDGPFMAYVARPAGKPKAAVVVIQEIFGVNATMQHKSDWLAGEGFLAISPDLFWRLEPGVQLTDKSEAE